ncbi:MAG: tight adherence protein C [Halioglobus sp.]|jgi:tight adherence protein C
MILYIAISLAFGAAVLCTIGVFGMVSSRAARHEENALYVPESDSAAVAKAMSIYGNFASQNIWAKKRDELKKNLLLSGSPYGGISETEYLACAMAAACVVFAGGIALLALTGGLALGTLLFLSGLALVIFWLANEWLGNLLSERQAKLALHFPYFLDLSVMTMEAGASFNESIDIYVRETPRSPLTEELNSVASSMRMGRTLNEALNDFEKRTTVEDILGTLRAVKQGVRMGTPLSVVLKDQAEILRFRRSQSAERVAEEMKIKMQGPAMLMMISVLLLILGPAFLEMFGSGVI